MNKKFTMTWHEAVQWYKDLPNNEENILDNYFDDNILEAAERYSESSEFKEISKLLKNSNKILDLAAGRGIASYGFSKLGKNVTALEPDKNELVGNEAIKKLSEISSLNIEIIEAYSEEIPFESNSFDAVFVRQGVHHFHDMQKSLNEIFRVLKPNGIFLAIREHVIKDKNDLNLFLNKHPLHKHYGGEMAYTLNEYIQFIENSGFQITNIYKPFDSNINMFPDSLEKLRKRLDKYYKYEISDELFEKHLEKYNNRTFSGALYSFIGVKN